MKEEKKRSSSACDSRRKTYCAAAPAKEEAAARKTADRAGVLSRHSERGPVACRAEAEKGTEAAERDEDASLVLRLRGLCHRLGLHRNRRGHLRSTSARASREDHRNEAVHRYELCPADSTTHSAS